jgi:hypothetical protein
MFMAFEVGQVGNRRTRLKNNYKWPNGKRRTKNNCITALNLSLNIAYFLFEMISELYVATGSTFE